MSLGVRFRRNLLVVAPVRTVQVEGVPCVIGARVVHACTLARRTFVLVLGSVHLGNMRIAGRIVNP